MTKLTTMANTTDSAGYYKPKKVKVDIYHIINSIRHKRMLKNNKRICTKVKFKTLFTVKNINRSKAFLCVYTVES